MKNTNELNEEHNANKCKQQNSRVLDEYLCMHRRPRDPLLNHIGSNHFARAAANAENDPLRTAATPKTIH